MVGIIRLNNDPHRQAQALLTWYANGSLEPGEAAAVEEHLAQCAQCRADLKLEHQLSAGIANLPMDMEGGWTALRERVQSQPQGQAPGVGAAAVGLPRPAFLRRPVPIGWALMAQAASLALVIGLAGFSMSPTRTAAYRTLGSAPAAGIGNVVVVFKPSTAEQDLRGALVRSGARLVDGPTASDAYVLRVAPGLRSASLSRLRADSHVVLAEPIDADGRP